jgi:hypothetical protein
MLFALLANVSKLKLGAYFLKAYKLDSTLASSRSPVDRLNFHLDSRKFGSQTFYTDLSSRLAALFSQLAFGIPHRTPPPASPTFSFLAMRAR